MARIRAFCLLLAALLLAGGGCSDDDSAPPPVAAWQTDSATTAPQTVDQQHSPPAPATQNNSKPPATKQPDKPKSKPRRPPPDPLAHADNDAARALSRVADEAAEALRLKKTLVVWVLDRSPGSLDSLRRLTFEVPLSRVMETAVNRAAKYTETNGDDSQAPESGRLANAVVTCGAGSGGPKVDILTPDPITDGQQLDRLAGGVSETADDPAATFAGVNQAAEHFLRYRARGYEMLFVVVANNAGENWDEFDAAVAKLRRGAVPVFAIGAAVPFNRMFHYPEEGMATRPATIPCESCDLEQIDLGLPLGQSDTDLTDSGYGPFGLERLCRATDGAFLRLRSSSMSPGWQRDESGRIEPRLLRRYASDYVSPKQYADLLAANGACRALHEAARLPYAAPLGGNRGGNVEMRFPRGRDEADLARRVGLAQRAAAERSPDVDRMYDALAAGEADRSKLTSPRWQAEYDLAMGRILAAKARIDGYNTQLAIVKQGKPFKNKTSSIWLLQPAETNSAGSAMEKMAERSRMYLQRVMKEHAGTPWAAMAMRELSAHLGWEWSEQ